MCLVEWPIVSGLGGIGFRVRCRYRWCGRGAWFCVSGLCVSGCETGYSDDDDDDDDDETAMASRPAGMNQLKLVTKPARGSGMDGEEEVVVVVMVVEVDK
jgi:hypothetical protein